MKTNILLLDSVADLDHLIGSAFGLSSDLGRSLKIAYIWDFVWSGGGEFAGTSSPEITPGIQFAQRKMEEEYHVAETRIKEVCARYLSEFSQSVAYQIDISISARWEYLQKELKKADDVLLLMSNRNTYAERSGGMINHAALIEEIRCPVLLLPADRRFISINSMVYAANYHPEDLEALHHLDRWMEKAENICLTVFHYTDKETFHEKLLWEGFKRLAADSVSNLSLRFLRQSSGDKTDALLAAAQSDQTDLFIMLKEKKGFFSDLFTSSDTRYIMSRFNKPVLIYHQKTWSS